MSRFSRGSIAKGDRDPGVFQEQMHREKAGEVSLSQAEPSGHHGRGPGHCPVGKETHGKIVSREWMGADVLHKIFSGLAGEQAGGVLWRGWG